MRNLPETEFYLSTPERFNKELAKRLKALKAQCKRDKVTLYASESLDDGRIVYRIKELPTFKAIFAHPRLV